MAKQVRADPRYLHDHGNRFNWLEDTAAAVLALRDSRVRDRLQQSPQLLVLAANLAPLVGSEEAELVVQHLSLKDLYLCLGRRLDGARLPQARRVVEAGHQGARSVPAGHRRWYRRGGVARGGGPEQLLPAPGRLIGPTGPGAAPVP